MIKEYIKNILLYLLYYRAIKKLLIKNDYKKIQVYNFSHWHFGYAYFIGQRSNEKFFIKVDTKLCLLENDVRVYKLADKVLKKYLIKIDNYFLLDDMQIIVYDFMDETIELTEEYLLKNESFIEEMILILNSLKKLEIIHRDIKLDNFLIANKKIKILDFTFSNSKNISLGFKEFELNMYNCRVLAALGDGLNPQPFVWNDFYALKNILLNLEKKFNMNISKYMQELNVEDTITYKVVPSTEYVKWVAFKKKIKLLLGIRR